MVSILKHVAESPIADHELDDETDLGEDGDDLIDRLDGIDLHDESDKGAAELLSRLTADERKEFEDMISSGRIVSLIPDEEKRDAWWINFKPKLVSEDSDSPSSGLGDRRDLINRLPQLSAICGREPSPYLKYCLINLFISYCYTCRLFNGDHRSCADEFLEELTLRCPVVRDGTVFHDTGTALQHCLHELTIEQHITEAFARQLLEDVKCILLDKNAVLELLSHMWFVVRTCLSCTRLKESRKDNRLLLKKMEYLIAWSKERGEELQLLVHEVDVQILQSAPKSREPGERCGLRV